jgi:hypothetical protein
MLIRTFNIQQCALIQEARNQEYLALTRTKFLSSRSQFTEALPAINRKITLPLKLSLVITVGSNQRPCWLLICSIMMSSLERAPNNGRNPSSSMPSTNIMLITDPSSNSTPNISRSPRRAKWSSRRD